LEDPGVDGRIILRWSFAVAPACSITHVWPMSLPKVYKISGSHTGVAGHLTLPVNGALLSKDNHSSWPASPIQMKAVIYKKQRTCSTVRTHDYQEREGTQYYTELREYTQIFALLGCYAAQIGSYRRFGTTHRSHLWPLDPWLRAEKRFCNSVFNEQLCLTDIYRYLCVTVLRNVGSLSPNNTASHATRQSLCAPAEHRTRYSELRRHDGTTSDCPQTWPSANRCPSALQPQFNLLLLTASTVLLWDLPVCTKLHFPRIRRAIWYAWN
jgi:hypothetical protein